MMRIWQLDPANLTPYYNLAICEALAQAGAHVTYFTSPFLYDALPLSTSFTTEYLYFRGVSQPWLKQTPRLRQALRGLTYPLGHWELIRRAQQQPPDVLHIQWSRLPRLDHWMIQSMKKLKIPIVHTVHDVVPLFDASLRQTLERVYQSVDALIVHGETNRRDLLTTYPSLREHVTILTLPHIELTEFQSPANATPEQARRKLDLPNDAFVIGFFGVIKTYKGLDVLTTAWPHVQAALPKAHLLIAGKPDGPAEAALLHELKKLPKTHVADFFIPLSDVWAYHIASDIMVFPYHSITQSGALISAMSYGVPIIVTDVGGLPELVDGNGWVIPKNDPEALAQTIINALSNADTLRLMGARSREIIQEQHSRAAVAQQLLALYQSIIRSLNTG
ncbi:MAG: glycosyltransferase family 4 protein [Anaerolineae bacterium]